MGLYHFFHRIRCSRISLLLRSNKRNICWLAGSLIAFFINETLLSNWNVPLIRNHFNDLLAMPAMVSYINLILVFFKKKPITGIGTILLIACGCGFMWEVVAVWIKPSSTCDILDFFCYFIGAVIYKLSIVI